MLSIGNKVYDLQLASLLVGQPITWEQVNLSQPQMALGALTAMPRSVPPAMTTAAFRDATATGDDVSTVTCNIRVSQSEQIYAMHPSLLI